MYLYLRTYIYIYRERYVYIYIYTCICRQQDQHLCMHTFTAFTFWPLTHIGTWRVGSWCSIFVESWVFGYNWFSQITLSVGSQSFDPPTEPKLWLTKQTWPSCIVNPKSRTDAWICCRSLCLWCSSGDDADRGRGHVNVLSALFVKMGPLSCFMLLS